MFKKFLTITLSFVLIATSVAFTPKENVKASIVGGQCGDDLEWSLDTDTGELSIFGTGDMWDYDPYNDIYPTFFDYRNDVKTLVFQEGVNCVGEMSLYGLQNMKSITIPASLTSVRHRALSHADSLEEFYIDSNNEVFENREGCHAIVEKDTDTLVWGCKETNILSSIKTIEGYAFQDLISLNTVTLPEGLEKISGDAFIGCESLTTVNIPASVSSIEYPFNRCCGLETISVDPKNVNYDSRNNCNAIMDTKENILIQGCKNTVIPEETVRIEGKSFEGMRDLESIIIPKKVESMGWGAFWCCSNLDYVFLPDNINDISDNAFDDCAENITFSVLERSYAEQYCKDHNFNYVKRSKGTVSGQCGDSLYWKLDLSTQVLTISGTGDMWDYSSEDGTNPTPWFEYKDEIKSIVVEEGCTGLGREAFNQCWCAESVSIPASVTKIPSDWVLKDMIALTSIKVDSDNPVYDSRNDCNAIIETDKNEIVYGCNTTIIPEDIVSVGRNAFFGSGIIGIDFPDSVTHIGVDAFMWSNLESVYIPKNISYIEEKAFSALNYCLEMKVSSENPVYDSRNNCNAIILTYMDEIIAACQNTTIEDTVKIIGKGSYQGQRSLEEITIPKNVEMIRAHAFEQCDALEKIVIKDKKIAFPLEPGESWRIWENVLPEHTTIYAYEQTAAESYAEQFGNGFESLGKDGVLVYSGEYGEGELGKEVLFTLDTGTKELNVFGIGDMWGVDPESNPWQNREQYADQIIIGNRINSIGRYDFYNLYNATKVDIPDSVKFIGERAFMKSGLTNVNIPKYVEQIEFEAFGFTPNMVAMTVDPDNKNYDSRNDCNAIIDKNEKVINSGCRNSQFPEDIHLIGDGAFAGVASLFGSTEVTLPNTIDAMFYKAFEGSGLTKVTLPKEFNFIGTGAFDDSENLNMVVIYNKDINFPVKEDGKFEYVMPIKTTVKSYNVSNAHNYCRQTTNPFIPFEEETKKKEEPTTKPVVKKQHTYYYMLAKANSKGQRKIKLSWNKVKGATKYVIYGNKCHTKEKKYPCKYLRTLKGNKRSYTFKHLKKHKAYKYYVLAYKGDKLLTKSVVCHVITGCYKGKNANTKSVKVNKSKLKLKVGKTFKIKAKIKVYKNKKALGPQHAKPIRYVSANKFIASVNKKGVIKGVKKGTTHIYVQAINGVWKKVKVRVR